MTNTLVKLRVGNKHYETNVDLDEALKLKKGEGNVNAAWQDTNIYHDAKKGTIVSQDDLQEAFGTTDLTEAVEKLIKKGDVQLTQEHRDEEREIRKKQIIDWFVRNAVDSQSNRPFTPEFLSSAIERAGINIDKRPVDQQVSKISEALKTIIPLKIETKKLIITIPAIYTGKVYGIINEYKEKEDWLSDGGLKCVVNVPVGLQMEFYDKLNAITHGAALSEEMKE